MKTFTKNKLAHVVLISSLITVPTVTFAQEQQTDDSTWTAETKEGFGFGTGALIGALLGGPAGAFITGIAGHLIAKESINKDEIAALSKAVETEQYANNELTAKYQAQLAKQESLYIAEIARLEQNQNLSSQLQAENLLMSLQFSTGSSEIKPHYQDQIIALAKLLAQSKELTVDLSGYTDLQGDTEFNHSLSIARVNSVKNALITHGVAPERIKLFAYGEDEPVVASSDKEVSFYDRRVVIKLQAEQVASEQVAKNY